MEDNEKKAEYKKFIPKKFKGKYDQLTEINIKPIDQTTMNSLKASLEKFMDSKIKLVCIKFQFISEEGILVEQGMTADGFDEEDWKQ